MCVCVFGGGALSVCVCVSFLNNISLSQYFEKYNILLDQIYLNDYKINCENTMACVYNNNEYDSSYIELLNVKTLVKYGVPC